MQNESEAGSTPQANARWQYKTIEATTPRELDEKLNKLPLGWEAVGFSVSSVASVTGMDEMISSVVDHVYAALVKRKSS